MRRSVYLLTGENAFAWENAGLSLTRSFIQICENKSINLILDEVVEITNNLEKVILKTVGGSIYSCSRLVVGTGVPGGLALLAPDGNHRINDHTPLKVIGLGNKNLGKINKNTPISSICLTAKSISAFYDPLKISSDGLTKISPLLGVLGWVMRIRVFNYRIMFQQIWIEKQSSKATIVEKLVNTINELRNLNFPDFLPLFAQRTKVGDGFHYQQSLKDLSNEHILVLGGLSAGRLPFLSSIIHVYAGWGN